MPTHIGRVIEPFNWPKLVEETIRRRTEEGLTQKAHAALAGVSIPTMIAFERSETSLSMGKVLDILRVVGLVAIERPKDKLAAFAEEAEARWFQLIQELPADSPARHPHGYYIYSYEIGGEIKKYGHSSEYISRLTEAAYEGYSGWPPFLIPMGTGVVAYPIDDYTECWFKDEYTMFQAAHSDFWRASQKGYMHLHRGYQEDSMDMVEPGTIFDLTLPILRAGEILLHAGRLANLIAVNPAEARVNIRTQYTGLQGRRLSSWANPSVYFLENKTCLQDNVELAVEFQASDIEEQLDRVVFTLLKDLYAHFGFFKLSEELVKNELATMISKKKLGVIPSF